MTRPQPGAGTLVTGVDGCKAGWICVTALLAPNALEMPRFEVVRDFKELIEATNQVAAVNVDIPIGLSEDGRREADTLARGLLGPRRSSVFPAPARSLLNAEGDYAELNALSKTIRAGLSRQTYGILAKMRDADATMTPALQARVRESHPEVSFRGLKGDYLEQPKRTQEGHLERLRLLAGVYGPAVWDWRAPRGAALDDLLDAAVLAWTAARVVRGEARTLPDRPPTDGRGLRMEIVY